MRNSWNAAVLWFISMAKKLTKSKKQLSVLQPMPALAFDVAEIKAWGDLWRGVVGSTNKAGVAGTKLADRFDKKQGMDFGVVFDTAFSKALSKMLGDIPVVEPINDSLLPPPSHPNAVEKGKTRIVGGIRPQNYDAAYRPDGPRVVYDSKTLNDRKSIGKNWQNMVNDLATEASTVHTRFPYCIVVFIVALPKPALQISQERALVRTLERLGSREDELDQHHLAEAIAMVVWDPDTGQIDPDVPPSTSVLRIENLPNRIYPAYLDRYKNLPPHEAEEVEDAAEDTGDYSEG
jgi:hypothetical protein